MTSASARLATTSTFWVAVVVTTWTSALVEVVALVTASAVAKERARERARERTVRRVIKDHERQIRSKCSLLVLVIVGRMRSDSSLKKQARWTDSRCSRLQRVTLRASAS